MFNNYNILYPDMQVVNLTSCEQEIPDFYKWR